MAKALLSFERETLATNIHFHQPNKEINLEDTPFKVLEKNTAWDFCENRIAGASSFGFGGMNARVVLQERKKQNTDNDSEEIP